jgi:hypothetical protein
MCQLPTEDSDCETAVREGILISLKHHILVTITLRDRRYRGNALVITSKEVEMKVKDVIIGL